MQITILGAGYVGLVTGVCLADQGHAVTVVESNPSRLAPLQDGVAPFHEPGLPEILSKNINAGRLQATDDAAVGLSRADIVLVCVGTPLREDGDADLSQIEAASTAVARHAPRFPVVYRSTLPLGTTDELGTWLQRDSLDDVVTNPEFLRQGSAIADFLNPTRIVVGTPDGSRTAAAERLLLLYDGLGAQTLVTDFHSAEMIKNAANAFLATKLSFINEVADLCEAYGADVEDVVVGIGMDPRIGSTYLRPGIGFGGSCLPKELANMVRLGNKHGLTMPLMAGAAQTNDARATRIVDRLEDQFGRVDGCRVAVLGLAFKPDTDDLRYSPALALSETLLARGASVVAHDPVVPVAATSRIAGLERVAVAEDAISGADLVILATEWRQYRDLDWASLGVVARRRIVFDGRNALDLKALRSAGWEVTRVGLAAA
jgi:UDPglucose 6-dehydrogenase